MLAFAPHPGQPTTRANLWFNRRMLRWLTGLVLVGLLVGGGAYWVAGRGEPPTISIDQPGRVVGQSGALDVVVAAPRGALTSLAIALEQNGRTIPLFSLDA